jgi:flagellar biogenesis protein FliO
METYQTRLETARSQVEEQELLIAVHKQTITRLKEQSQSTEIEEKIVELMERKLRAFRADLGRLAN